MDKGADCAPSSLNQKILRMVCHLCYSATRTKYSTVYDCGHCKNTNVIEPCKTLLTTFSSFLLSLIYLRKIIMQTSRVRYKVELKDDTGSIMATLLKMAAKKFYQFDGAEVMENSNQVMLF